MGFPMRLALRLRVQAGADELAHHPGQPNVPGNNFVGQPKHRSKPAKCKHKVDRSNAICAKCLFYAESQAQVCGCDTRLLVVVVMLCASHFANPTAPLKHHADQSHHVVHKCYLHRRAPTVLAGLRHDTLVICRAFAATFGRHLQTPPEIQADLHRNLQDLVDSEESGRTRRPASVCRQLGPISVLSV